MMSELPDFEMLSGGRSIRDRAPTLFYHLQPYGLGTADRECLSSYVLRLCHEHGVSPNSLSKLPELDARLRKNIKFTLWNNPHFDGGGDAAEFVVSQMSNLTGCTDLRGLTMLPLSHSVGGWKLVSGHRKWCPACLEGSDRPDIGYGRLLWRFQCVVACPTHRTLLVSKCKCGERIKPPLGRKNLPAVCPHCRYELSLTPSVSRLPTAIELRTADLVADVLQDKRFDAGGWPTHSEGVAKFLRDATILYGRGEICTFARTIGISKGMMHEWVNEKVRPSFGQIIDIALRLGCSIVDVFSGDATGTKYPNSSIRGAVGKKRRRSRTKAVVLEERAKLMGILSEPLAVSVEEAARRLDINPKTLRSQYSDMVTKIACRFKEHTAAQHVERNSAYIKLMRSKAKDLMKEGLTPSLTRVLVGLPPSHQNWGWMRNELAKIVTELMD